MQEPKLYVDVYNRGRAPITVGTLTLVGIGVATKSLPVVGWPLQPPDCVLPFRIEGHSGTRWIFPAHDLAKEWPNRRLTRLEVTVRLANGKFLTLKVDTTYIDILNDPSLRDYLNDSSKLWPELRSLSGEASSRTPTTSAEGQSAPGDQGDAETRTA